MTNNICHNKIHILDICINTSAWRSEKQISAVYMKQLLRSYLNQISEKKISDLSFHQAEYLFFLIIQDYKQKKITLDELSGLGNIFFSDLAYKDKKSALFQVTLAAGEANYAAKQDNFDDLTSFLHEIESYYQFYKTNRNSLLKE